MKRVKKLSQIFLVLIFLTSCKSSINENLPINNEENINKTNLGIFVVHNKIKPKALVNENLDIAYYLAGEDVEDNWIVYPWE